MMKRYAWVFLLLVACSENPVEPDPIPTLCDKRYACQVNGVDLAVVAVQPDTVAGGRVPAEDARFHFVIINRGDQSSQPTVARLRFYGKEASVPIAAVAPGDSIVATANVVIQRAYLYGAEDLPSESAVVDLAIDDANDDNDVMTSPPVSTDRPYVTFSVPKAPLETVRVNGSTSTSLGFNITGGAAVRVLICAQRNGETCTAGNWQALQRRDPSGSGSFGPVFVTQSGLDTPPEGEYQIVMCIVPRNYAPMFIETANPDHHCLDAGNLLVLP